MGKQEYAWRRAERLIEHIRGEIDAATLATAARAAGWDIGAQRAQEILRELKDYGLVIRIKPHAYRYNARA